MRHRGHRTTQQAWRNLPVTSLSDRLWCMHTCPAKPLGGRRASLIAPWSLRVECDHEGKQARRYAFLPPTRLYLTLNSRTVGRMGIRLPQNLLARADHRSAFEQRTHLAVVLRPARRAAMNTDCARPGAAACYLSGIARARGGRPSRATSITDRDVWAS